MMSSRCWATSPAAPRSNEQPARSRAVAMWVQNLTGSLSAASSATQARLRPVSRSSHCATTVVLPYPAGAAIKVSGHSLTDRSRVTTRRSRAHPLRPHAGRMQLRFQERVDARQRGPTLTAAGPLYDFSAEVTFPPGVVDLHHKGRRTLGSHHVAAESRRIGRRSTASRRAITAACVGNAAEWYDFAIYGALATVIGVVFFPAENPAVALSAAFAAYGTALLRAATRCARLRPDG